MSIVQSRAARIGLVCLLGAVAGCGGGGGAAGVTPAAAIVVDGSSTVVRISEAAQARFSR